MKKLLLSLMAVMLLCGMAQGQVTLDQHNWNITSDSFHVVGAAVDTGSVISTGYFGAFAIWAEWDSIGACDSAHVHIIIDLSPVSDTAARFWYVGLDTVICSTAVASLPANIFEDFSTLLGDLPYARYRTVATMGTNDSARVVIKTFRRE